MIEVCGTKALAKWFQLCCRPSRARLSNCLECFQHRHRQGDDGDVGCPFAIRIQVRSVERRRPGGPQVGVVTSCHLIHDHDKNPLIFAHLCLAQDNLKFIKALGEMNASKEKMAGDLALEKGVELSTYQISVLMRAGRIERHLRETDELTKLKEPIHSLSFLQESTEDGTTFRSGIGTFTQEELSNLEQYGDVVAIKPTFVPLNLNWSGIPLTVVGRERKIHCAGLFLCAWTPAETFNWILHLLACASLWAQIADNHLGR
jgi:hypothetical protein